MITALLKAPVDLIWNGGIGTYVKGVAETHADVGDKANDSLRVNGADLRCRVFGEGGNLGLTQLGRIDFCNKGGACNTDFIDNAAGVDCSDHEVNIKILLNDVVAKKELTSKQRNSLLVKMTDTVSEKVLNNNYQQTQAISLAEMEALPRLGEYRRLINDLEHQGRLNRKLEYIPTDEELLERRGLGYSLSRPELSVLISYVKVQLKELLATDNIANNSYLAPMVEDAFPKQLLRKYKDNIHQHILRKEIIATQLANDLVDNMGITFCHRLMEATGEGAENVALAYVTARDIFCFDDFKQQVALLDYKVPANDQLKLLSSMMRRVRRGTRWFLRNRRGLLNPSEDVAFFKPLVKAAIKETPNVLSPDELQVWNDKCAHFQALGLDQELAKLMAMPGHLFSGLGIAEVIKLSSAKKAKSGNRVNHGATVKQVVAMHHYLGDKLGLYWFAHVITDAHIETYWQAMARESFIDDLDKVLRLMSVELIRLAKGKFSNEQVLERCEQQYSTLFSRWQQVMHDLQANQNTDFAMFSVAMRELFALTEATQECRIK